MRYIPSYLSFLIFLCFLYIIFLLHRNAFFLYPLNTILEKPNTGTYEELYFANGIHGWYYFASSRTNNPSILFYFNGNSGNISSRISYIKIIHKFFPDYDIFHMDYPGFGNSLGNIPTYDEICDKCFHVYKKVLENKSFPKIGIWAEDIGCLVALSISYNINKLLSNDRNPDWYVFFDGMFDIKKVYYDYIPFFLQIFIIPFLSQKISLDYYRDEYMKIQKLCIIHSNENQIFSIHNVINMFLNTLILKPQQYKLVCIEGNEKNSLFLLENQEKIYSSLQNFL